MQFSSLGEHIEFGSGGTSCSVIIFIIDNAQDSGINPMLLQSAYGLTPSEAKVAVTLLDSSSAKEVANKLGVSLNTVQTQIKHIYAKLGVDTKTRFVKLLLGLATHNP